MRRCRAGSIASWSRPASRSPRAATWWKCTTSRTSDRRSSRSSRTRLNAERQLASLKSKESKELSQKERSDLTRDIEVADATARSKGEALEALIKSVDADRAADRAGFFFLKAPAFTNEQALRLNRKEWTVLNSNFKEELTNVTVKPSDKLLWLGAKDGPWEIEMKIPQKHIGQVLQSFHGDHNKELDVDFLLRSDPARKFKGKLRLDKIAGEALSNKEDKDESEPVVLAYVRIDNDDPDLPKIDGGSRAAAGDAAERHRGPRQDLLRQPPDGLFAVLRRL